MIAAGFIAAFAVSTVLGGPIIRWLKRVGAAQTVSENAPDRHRAKQGTTTMGGLLILAGLTATVAVYAAFQPRFAGCFALLALTLANGLIGFADDLLIARRGRNLGLTARQKLALQFAAAIGFCVWLYTSAVPGVTTHLQAGSWDVDLGGWYYPLGVLFIVGMSNAINLTDGLDGLAGGISAMLALALAVTVASPGGLSGDWLRLFAGALAGGCAGFLWFNVHPALV